MRSTHLSFSARLPCRTCVDLTAAGLLSAYTPHRLLEQVVSCSPSQQKHAHRRPGEPSRNDSGHAHPVADHAAQEASDRVAQHEPDETSVEGRAGRAAEFPGVF